MIKMYAIKNCDTVKKAMKHLEAKGLEFDFFDFKKEVPTKEDILRWKDFFSDWPVNTRGRTFRLFKDDFESATDAKKIALIQENLSAVKRPVLEVNGKVVAMGYDKEAYEGL
ncbi:Spx/MgsR family RNA polymerase-binding regulatory protein [Halobacteriovorax sp. GB3]|uniref:arsenate reductase family protein n=1 Tax=Halobacteriovorax sp. GB3 TaxID=2719615 RepID=UPI00235FB88A|nr:Spx/MgsR family RNA polymerase-binding regulatory protein [Halobacteriovorax sp. GB3]MDD0854032.1 Spx/MgsR family RNA polymerase-binding regulatory protein [Halobacteriovorax sp. GB3]